MTTDEQPYTFDRVIRMLLTAAAVVAVFALLRYLADVLVPFAVAAITAYLLNPVVTRIERRTRRRGLAVAGTLIGLGVIGLAFVLIVLPLIFGQLSRFEQNLSRLRVDLAGSFGTTVAATRPTSGLAGATSRPVAYGRSTSGLRELMEGWDTFRRTAGQASRAERLRRLRDSVDGTQVGAVIEHAAKFVQTQEFRALLLNALKRLAVGGVTVINFAVELAVGATVLIVILIYLVFLLLDFDAYARTWKGLLPSRYRAGILRFLQEFEVAMRRYFRGQFVVALTVGILFSVGFSLVGLPMAVPFGLFVGLLNMVPYLQLVALVPAGLLALLRSVETNGSVLGSLVLVGLVFAVVQVIQDAVIVPRVMGKATGLRPVSILLGVFIWGKLLGFIGLILAIPLTCLGIAYYRRLTIGVQNGE